MLESKKTFLFKTNRQKAPTIFYICEQCGFTVFLHKCGAGRVLSLVFLWGQGFVWPQEFHSLRDTMRFMLPSGCRAQNIVGFGRASDKTSDLENEPNSSVLDQINLLTV